MYQAFSRQRDVDNPSLEVPSPGLVGRPRRYWQFHRVKVPIPPCPDSSPRSGVLQHGPSLDQPSSHPKWRRVRRVMDKATHVLRPGPNTRAIGQGTLLLGLQTLKESSSAFPPVQSIAGGILELIRCYETATQNETDLQRLYQCTDAILKHLEVAQNRFNQHAATVGDEFSETVRDSFTEFEAAVQGISRQVVALTSRDKSRIKRYLLASGHKSQISDLLSQLSEADRRFSLCLNMDTNISVKFVGGDTNARVSAIQCLGYDTNRCVNEIQSTLTHRVKDTDHRDREIHIIQEEIRGMRTDVARLSFSVGLFAMARS